MAFMTKYYNSAKGTNYTSSVFSSITLHQI